MSLEVVDYYRKSKTIKEQCKCYLFYHVILTLDDGSNVDGIIEEINGDEVKILIGEDMMENTMNMSRQPGTGSNRYRRFRPRNYPVNRIGNVGLLPYPPIPIIPPIYPIPYPYPYYPIL